MLDSDRRPLRFGQIGDRQIDLLEHSLGAVSQLSNLIVAEVFEIGRNGHYCLADCPTGACAPCTSSFKAGTRYDSMISDTAGSADVRRVGTRSAAGGASAKTIALSSAR